MDPDARTMGIAHQAKLKVIEDATVTDSLLLPFSFCVRRGDPHGKPVTRGPIPQESQRVLRSPAPLA